MSQSARRWPSECRAWAHGLTPWLASQRAWALRRYGLSMTALSWEIFGRLHAGSAEVLKDVARQAVLRVRARRAALG